MPDSKQKIDPNHVFPINGSEFFCQFKLKSADSYESDKGGSINLIDFTKMKSRRRIVGLEHRSHTNKES